MTNLEKMKRRARVLAWIIAGLIPRNALININVEELNLIKIENHRQVMSEPPQDRFGRLETSLDTISGVKVVPDQAADSRISEAWALGNTVDVVGTTSADTVGGVSVVWAGVDG